MNPDVSHPWGSRVSPDSAGQSIMRAAGGGGGGRAGRMRTPALISGQSRMRLDNFRPHEGSGRSGLRQLYDKMALAGRARGNEAGRPPLALMAVPIPESAWGA